MIKGAREKEEHVTHVNIVTFNVNTKIRVMPVSNNSPFADLNM